MPHERTTQKRFESFWDTSAIVFAINCLSSNFPSSDAIGDVVPYDPDRLSEGQILNRKYFGRSVRVYLVNDKWQPIRYKLLYIAIKLGVIFIYIYIYIYIYIHIYMGYRIAYLYFAVTNSKGQCQGHGHFDSDYLWKWWQIGKKWRLPSIRELPIVFWVAYLHLTMDHSKGQDHLGNADRLGKHGYCH